MRKYWVSAAPVLALVMAASVSAAPARTQTVHAQDASWLAFLGCWRADGDKSDNMLCVVPEGEGVRMITMAGKTIQSESRIVANGEPRAINEEGCSGTETARWSADEQRVFMIADLSCGKNLTRKASSVFAMLSSHWVNVQSVTTGGNTDTRTIRYVEVDPNELPAEVAQALKNNRLARETARDAAAAPIDLADVQEAVKIVDAGAVQAWLTAANQGFELNGKKLVQLADAGVPSSVIDVMVALSNPEHFAVRQRLASENDGRRRSRGRGSDPCFGDGYGYGSMYDPYGYRRGYGYGDGYGDGYGCGGGSYYPGGYGGYGYYGPTVVVIEKPGSTDSQPGKVTRKGYSKGRSNGDDSSTSTTSTTSTPSTKSPSPSGSSSSGSSTSTTTHKAHPRDQ